MGSKTKIIVLHMKEIIYTAVFAALGILLIILLIVMFRPGGKDKSADAKKQYTPGAVSYTHLDVYKRQLFFRSSANFSAVSFRAVFSSSVMASELPSSSVLL